MRMLVRLICLLCIWLPAKVQAADQPPSPAETGSADVTASKGITKTWAFDVEGTKISITARSCVPPAYKYSVLSIVATPAKTVACLSLREEVRCLSEVLEQLPSNGIDPKSIISIYLPRIFDVDTQRQLAIAAARSKEFQKQTKQTGLWEAGKNVTKLMNSFGACEELSKPFEKYGTTFEVGSAEETLGTRISALGIADLPPDISPKTIVPYTSTLSLVIKKQELQVPETGRSGLTR